MGKLGRRHMDTNGKIILLKNLVKVLEEIEDIIKETKELKIKRNPVNFCNYAKVFIWM